jgi:hypothetical protein
MTKEEKRSTLTYAKIKLLITLVIQCSSHLFEDDDVFFLPSPTIVLIVQQHKRFRKKIHNISLKRLKKK